jgi:hypothetical protein
MEVQQASPTGKTPNDLDNNAKGEKEIETKSEVVGS